MQTIRRCALALAVTCTAALAIVPGDAGAASAAAVVKLARPIAALVDDLAPGPASSDPRNLTAMKGTLYFTAWTKGHGRQLWKTNGTKAGTVMLTRVPGPVGANPKDLTVADGVLFFSAVDPQHGQELWKSNGTVAGTTMVCDIVPGPSGSSPQDITYAIGQQETSPPNQVLVYFTAWTPASAWQLWKSNGTAAGTVMITDVDPGQIGLDPKDIVPLTGMTAMFAGVDPGQGFEPWVTDGTTSGTAVYEDQGPGMAGSHSPNITPELYQVGILATLPIWYFSAYYGTHGRQFFVAYPGDPPADVYDINPGSAKSNPGPFDSVANETGLLTATTATGERELFSVQQPPFPPSSAGPQPGTATEVTGVGPGMGSNPVLAPTNQIGVTPFALPVTRTYFAGDLAGHGRQLWQADETVTATPGEGGTVGFSVNAVRPVDVIGTGSAYPRDLTSVGGTPVGGAKSGATELFRAANGKHGRQLWYSDGWSSNTHYVIGTAGSDPQEITVIGQTAYFTAFSPAHGRELWKVTVPPSPQLFLLGPASAVKTGAKVTVTVTMQPAPKAPRPSGTVTFYQDGVKIGRVTLKRQASGELAASLSTKARSGDHQIVAVYSGNGHYLPATSNTIEVTGD